MSEPMSAHGTWRAAGTAQNHAGPPITAPTPWSAEPVYLPHQPGGAAAPYTQLAELPAPAPSPPPLNPQNSPTFYPQSAHPQPAYPQPVFAPAVQPLVPTAEDDEAGWAEDLPSLRSLLRFSTALTSSAVVHLAALLMLGAWLVPQWLRSEPPQLVASIEELPPTEPMVPELVYEETGSPTDLLAEAVASVNTVVGAMESSEAPAELQLDSPVSQEPTETKIVVGLTDVFASNRQKFSHDLPRGMVGEALAVADNNSQAVDRIAQELIAKLTRNKVLLIWCFDESESMQDDRQEIISRIDNMYEQIGASGAAPGDAVISAVTSYGHTVSIRTPSPTRDLDVIRSAMAAVPIDTTGVELQCQAVGQSIATFRNAAKTSHRDMMLVLCTDESGEPGDNMSRLEAALAEAKSSHCSIYVIGREAMFGSPYAWMNWTVTAPVPGENRTVRERFVVQIDRGPETPFVEQLQTDGFGRRRDALPSGFGPYEQARMAHETGGIFFLLPSPEVRLLNRDTRKYDPYAMRPYLPDLSSRADYAAERDKNPLRATVWKVINELNPYGPTRGNVINVAQSFSADEATFVPEMNKEIRNAENFLAALEAAEQAMSAQTRERAREASPRWQADYDLIHAQVLAYRVRLIEYHAYLKDFVANPRQAPPPRSSRQFLAGWRLRLRDQTLTGAETEKMIAEAEVRFRKVIDLHAGTPWSVRAEEELRRGFGVELVPTYDTTPTPGNGQPGNRPRISRPKL